MAQSTPPIPIHCYTNPSFCQQSEYTHNDPIDDLPPPPPQQFQTDDLPPPPPPTPPAPINHGVIMQVQNQQSEIINYQSQYGHTNQAFKTRQEQNCIELDTRVRYAKTPGDRYCYLDNEQIKNTNNFETQNRERRINYERDNRSRYEFIDDDDEPIPLQPHNQLQRRASLTQMEMINHRQNLNFNRQPSYHGQRMQTMLTVPVNRVESNVHNTQKKLQRPRQDENNVVRYALVPADEAITDGNSSSWINTNYTSPRGRYARLPMQDEDPPILPDRNLREQIELRENVESSRNNIATQKLHEILTTPRKPRSKSEERNLSPGRRTPQRASQYATPPASATASPSGRVIVAGSSRRGTPVGTPQRTFSPGRVPQTSTPNKEIPPARRCLPLNEQQELCPASNCGRSRYASRHQDGTASLAASPIEFSSRFGEPPPRYAYVESTSESMPMVIGSPKYQVLPSRVESSQKRAYNSVENAFIARTAVVPPLSPPNSEANTTFASGLDKVERKSAPLILVLVGILTCGLAFYLSWTKGREYYYDSAAGCGVCCALAGASRSLRRTWTGFSLAGLSTISCAGILLMAAKSPRPGSPLHDITAGVLCGVSLLGAGLAILTLMSPKCSFGRHRRVHSWIPQFSP